MQIRLALISQLSASQLATFPSSVASPRGRGLHQKSKPAADQPSRLDTGDCPPTLPPSSALAKDVLNTARCCLCPSCKAPSATMEEQVDRLVKKAWFQFQDTPKSKRLLIAVSGIPGSGTNKNHVLKNSTHTPTCLHTSNLAIRSYRLLLLHEQAKPPSPPKSSPASTPSGARARPAWPLSPASPPSCPWTATT